MARWNVVMTASISAGQWQYNALVQEDGAEGGGNPRYDPRHKLDGVGAQAINSCFDPMKKLN
jgi:hypothetical protein